MFCKNCGKQLADSERFCPHCGTSTDKGATDGSSIAQPRSENVIAIVGFVFSFLMSLVGLICSIVGYKNSKRGGDHGGLAVAGIIISAVSIGITIILIIAYSSIAASYLSDPNYYYYYALSML